MRTFPFSLFVTLACLLLPLPHASAQAAHSHLTPRAALLAASTFCQKIGQPARSAATSTYEPTSKSFAPAEPPRSSWNIEFLDGTRIGLDDATGRVFQYSAPDIRNNFSPPSTFPPTMPRAIALARATALLNMTGLAGPLPELKESADQYAGPDNHTISIGPAWWFDWSPFLLKSANAAAQCSVVLDAPSGYLLDIHIKIGAIDANPAKDADDYHTFLLAYLHGMPQERRTELYQYLGWGGYTPDDPDFWNSLQDPIVISRDARFPGEPYRPEVLDALERALSVSKDENTRLKIAAILHRYDRSVGTKYLRTRAAPKFGIDAAAIFAQDRDKSYIPQILELIAPAGKPKRGSSISHDSFRTLIEEASQWRDPSITNALRTRYHLFREHRMTDPLLGEALATNGVTDIAKDLEAAYPSELNTGEDRARLGVALVKIQGVHHTSEIFRDLTTQLTAKPKPAYSKMMDAVITDDARSTIIQSFVRSGIEESIPALQEVVQNYVKHPVATPPNPNADSPYQVTAEEEVAALAGEALVRLHDPQAAPLLQKLLTAMETANVNQEEIQQTANALLSSGGGTEFLKTTMGNVWVRRAQARNHLKPLPEYMLAPQPYNPYTKI